MLKEQNPTLLIGSPRCPPYLKLLKLSRAKGNQEEKMRLAVEARVHLHFCTQLYREQCKLARYFIHEQPSFKMSWEREEVARMVKTPGVTRVTGHGKRGTSWWMTNSLRIARARTCRAVGENLQSADIITDAEAARTLQKRTR